MTGTTPETLTVRELPLEPGGEVEILLTSSAVRVRPTDGDAVILRSHGDDDLDDDFAIDARPGRVEVRDVQSGFRLGSLRIRTGRPPDLDIEVPRSATVAMRTVSGDIESSGLAGAVRLATTSGDLRVQADGGSVAAESMSGDVGIVATAAIAIRARTVSGDLTLRGPRFGALVAATTSGDIRVVGQLAERGDYALSSVSGDVELTTASPVRVDVQSVTGDVVSSGTRRAEGGRGHRTLIVGAGSIGVAIRTTSGDVRLHGVASLDAVPVAPEPPEAPEPAQAPEPPEPPVAPVRNVAEAEAAPNLVRATADGGGTGSTDRREEARLEILRALERGDLDIESASHRLEILEDAGPRSFRGWC